MPHVEVELRIAAPVADSWAAVMDVESYPHVMDNVRAVRITATTAPDTRTTAWSVDLKGSVLEWTESERLDHAAMRFDFHQLSGDLTDFSGYWGVRHGDDGGSVVTLSVDFEIGIPLLADMLNPVAAKALRDNAHQMLTALEQRLVGSTG
ncbi:type II toxin-antitoxin system RatA family toxin [Streptantibioticus silvisoli]|uniref:SRPBCC family protein n=1 Tax=Streptantibioticus silvisoli TaxID=2705255 RepID=A0ABT6W4P7_9ACTN|nr:SRPBCC family protein [Streptantibioticus silvisoli]MDI5964491.1 SRPBCC family protein [Streptantibioticus silvisoli]